MRYRMCCFLMMLSTLSTSLESPVAVSSNEVNSLSQDSIENISEGKTDNMQESMRSERSDPDDGSEGDHEEAKGDQISLDVSETLEKINPLTIASQVSQMFRKNDCKQECSKQKPSEKESSFNSQDAAVEEIRAILAKSDKQCCRESGQKKNTKSGSINHAKDDGASVLFSGDRFNRPAESRRENEKELKKDNHQHNMIKGPVYSMDGQTKEIRVPKQFSFFPEFPIYDDDISFVPDPLHGLLDQRYWSKNNDIFI